MADKMVYVNTRQEAIEARQKLRAEGYQAGFGKAKRWEGYNVWGDLHCFCWHKIKSALNKPKEMKT
jgi:hypothetical protein